VDAWRGRGGGLCGGKVFRWEGERLGGWGGGIGGFGGLEIDSQPMILERIGN